MQNNQSMLSFIRTLNVSPFICFLVSFSRSLFPLMCRSLPMHHFRKSLYNHLKLEVMLLYKVMDEVKAKTAALSSQLFVYIGSALCVL